MPTSAASATQPASIRGIVAAQRANECAAAGDIDGQTLWKRNAAINQEAARLEADARLAAAALDSNSDASSSNAASAGSAGLTIFSASRRHFAALSMK